MGDTPFWSGGRLGPYSVGRRYRDVGADLGRIYEAHNVETGALAVVLTPGRGEAWCPGATWTVRATSGAVPPFVAIEVEHAPGADSALHELTLMLHRLAGALARIEDRPDARAHLTREPLPSRPQRTETRRRWLLAGAGMVTAVGLTLALLTFRSLPPEPSETTQASTVAEAALEEEFTFIDGEDTTLPFIGRPMPDGPLKGQKRPPCLQGVQVEIRGGCWITMEQRAPCPKTTAEYEGKCYVPVTARPPEPRSLQP
jgi:hypothetical protein